MKNVLFIVLATLLSVSASAGDILFQGGLYYGSSYVDGIGRASLLMTGNPGYVLISTDQNKCDADSCQLVGISGDVSNALFRLEKTEDQGDSVAYSATPVELTESGKDSVSSEYQKMLSEIKITILANVSWDNALIATSNAKTPKTLNVRVEYKGRARVYSLKQTRQLF